MTIRVLHVGLGPIGAAVARQVAGRRALRIVGAVDVDPAKVGRDVGDVCGIDRRLRVAVSANLEESIKATNPDVALVCTSSSLKRALPQLEVLLKRRVPIVSSTEELAYPTKGNARIAKAIDARARGARVAVLGTGVNPGFCMDALPIMLTGVCAQVERIEVDRVQDARIRRLPFQQKIGAGLTREEFEKRVEEGSVRHVGLAESISMIADALGWKLDAIHDEIQPKIATASVSSAFLTVEPGFVVGLVQDGVGFRKGARLITLHMEAYLGAPESYDAVRVVGSPPIDMKIAGGIHGDVATASILVNSIPKVLNAAPGLRTMRDMALPSFSG